MVDLIHFFSQIISIICSALIVGYIQTATNIMDSTSWYKANICNYYKSNLKIAYLNINSIQNKLYEVKNMLKRNFFDILFVAESKIDNTFSNELLKQPGYRIIRRDRKKGAGGLIAYVREDLPVYRRRKLEPESVESICLDNMDAKKSRFIVCACYRSPEFCKVTNFVSGFCVFAQLSN